MITGYSDASNACSLMASMQSSKPTGRVRVLAGRRDGCKNERKRGMGERRRKLAFDWEEESKDERQDIHRTNVARYVISVAKTD